MGISLEICRKKLPIPMSDVSADLPREVISDILIRLPGKSIGRSRCVSKLWLSLLTSYDFIKAHLAHHSHLAHEQKLLLWSYHDSFSSLTLHPDGNHCKKIELFNEDVTTLLGCCNGLVLVDTEKEDKYLINCMTKEYIKLPDSPRPYPCFRKYGFGYDCLSDDYKIVSISECNNHTLVDIYSLKMRSWKRFGTFPYGHDIKCDCVFVSGALHWMAKKSSDKESLVIIAFDLSCEKFKEIPVPASVVYAILVLFGRLTVIDGCLGIVVKPYCGDLTEIWFMKSYSSVESWTKLVVDLKPICFHKDKFLFEDWWEDGKFKWYCLKNGRVEVCFVSNDRHHFDKGITYSESLVSPHFNYHNCGGKGQAINLAAIGRK